MSETDDLFDPDDPDPNQYEDPAFPWGHDPASSYDWADEPGPGWDWEPWIDEEADIDDGETALNDSDEDE